MGLRHINCKMLLPPRSTAHWKQLCCCACATDAEHLRIRGLRIREEHLILPRDALQVRHNKPSAGFLVQGGLNDGLGFIGFYGWRVKGCRV